jgi:hypothetical protein
MSAVERHRALVSRTAAPEVFAMRTLIVSLLALSAFGCAVSAEEGVDEVASSQDEISRAGSRNNIPDVRTRQREPFNDPNLVITERCEFKRFFSECTFTTTLRGERAAAIIAVLDRGVGRPDVVSNGSSIGTSQINCVRGSELAPASCAITTVDYPYFDNAWCTGGVSFFAKGLAFRDHDDVEVRKDGLTALWELQAELPEAERPAPCSRFSVVSFYGGASGLSCKVTLEESKVQGCDAAFARF